MLLTIEAYRFGEVSALAPFPYTRILFALLLGYIYFAEVPSVRELVGAVVIIGSGLFANKYMRIRP